MYLITCNQCSKEFEFTEGEQVFFAKKGFQPPKKCKKCKYFQRSQKEMKVLQYIKESKERNTSIKLTKSIIEEIAAILQETKR